MSLKNRLGKIIGAGLGFAGGGPIGSILGFGIGTVIDKLHDDGILIWDSSPSSANTDPTDFILSALILASAVVKSDGEVEDLELSYIRTFLADQFGPENVVDYVLIMEKAIEQEFDLRKTTHQIRQSTSYETRLQIIFFLFGIANADYHIDPREIATIKVISIHLGINASDYDSIKAMFYKEMDAYYKILEITPSTSDEEVKQAYRQMMLKYHPDKVIHLGEGVQKAAREKFQKVQEAYDAVKKERGFK